MVDVRVRDLSTNVLDERIALPVMLAPTGLHGHGHPLGECETARGAAAAGTVFVHGGSSSFSIEEVAAASNGPLWLQIYHLGRELTAMLVRRAAAAGYKAICITVDVPGDFRAKEGDRRNEFRPLAGAELGNFTGEAAGLGLERGTNQSSTWARPPFQPVTWDEIDWLHSLTPLPLVLKGIMTAADAVLCSQHGINGIIVSNHGGRIVDGTPATIEVLPEIADAVGGRLEIYLDGGVRRGTDVLKALALGARAVLIGRPYWWGLVTRGSDGVADVLNILRGELDEAMAFCGVISAASVPAGLVRPSVPLTAEAR
jgi:isopentenyl diphosphate isomerase/L-lactate dehydrogenase-like FMN-dependent dehydrogenase